MLANLFDDRSLENKNKKKLAQRTKICINNVY